MKIYREYAKTYINYTLCSQHDPVRRQGDSPGRRKKGDHLEQLNQRFVSTVHHEIQVQFEHKKRSQPGVD